MAIEDRRRHAAVAVRAHHRMDGRMHDHVRALGERLDLRGGGRRTRRGQCVVARVAADHHAAGRRIDAIGGVARDVGGTHRADLHVAEQPDGLRFVLRLEGAYVRERSGAACKPPLVLGHALRDFTGLDRGIGDVSDELLATHRDAELRRCVIAAHHVDLRAGREDHPAMLDEIDEAFAVIVVHVGEEDSVDLQRQNVGLRETQKRATPRIELEPHLHCNCRRRRHSGPACLARPGPDKPAGRLARR